MKNKTKTYILIVVVLGVWGTIGYKIINGLSPKDTISTDGDYEVSFSPKKIAKNETFEISSVDRDPFLGALRKKKKSRIQSLVKSVPKKVENNPIITYSGLIKKQNSSDLVFVVNINNNQYLLKKGQTVDSVKLIKGNEKGIMVRYNNKSQTIKRQ